VILYYRNRDGAKLCQRHQAHASLVPSHIYLRVLSCNCVFLTTATHALVQHVACGSEDVIQYNYAIIRGWQSFGCTN